MATSRKVQDEMTLEYYPEKLSIEEFIKEISDNLRWFKIIINLMH
jgi:hypothetical protein